MLYTNETLQPIQNTAPYTAPDGKKYPRNYPKDEIKDLHKVTETARPDDPALVITGFHIDEDFVQVWDTRSKTDDELADNMRQEVLSQIHVLESLVTQRRLREAMLTDDGNAWLADIEAQITGLRSQL